ncbi:Nn.00g035280.m01.CDS01 [Neocucurbitaria sp. VM-36]
MSWTFQLQNINRSFERIAACTEFMHRTELSFRALHERITFLEDRQAWQGPSDEQVDRVLRKILAEKFSDAGMQRVQNPNTMKDGDYFVENPKDLAIPRPIAIDPASLLVEPEAVPSKTYADTLDMLESRLSRFEPNQSAHEDVKDVKMNIDVKKSRSSNDV